MCWMRSPMTSMVASNRWFALLVCTACTALSACSAQTRVNSRANTTGAGSAGKPSDSNGSKEDRDASQPRVDTDVPSTEDVLVKDQSKVMDAGSAQDAAAS